MDKCEVNGCSKPVHNKRYVPDDDSGTVVKRWFCKDHLKDVDRGLQS